MTTETVPSPGTRLQLLLKERGLKQVELALMLGRSAQYVQDIIKGKKAMDALLAMDLEEALVSPTASQWLQWELEFQRSQVKAQASAKRDPKLKRRDVVEEFPFALDAIKMGWIEDSKDPSVLRDHLNAYMDNASVHVRHFKVSPAHETVAKSLQAWAAQCFIQADRTEILEDSHSEVDFKALLEDLRPLMKEESGVQRVREVLLSHGIRFLVVPSVSKAPVDGIASDNDGKPFVAVSLRHGQIDRFWFVLMHELAHIFHGHTSEQMTFDSYDQTAQSKYEAEADATAQEWILPKSRYDDFVFEYDFSLSAIQTFASGQGLHPAIVLGRLKRDGYVPWHKFAREHPSIRDDLAKA